jgi:SPP1 gp7 family putative phage head morphogenesis protein
LRDLALAAQGERLYRQAGAALDAGRPWADAGDSVAARIAGGYAIGILPGRREVARLFRSARDLSRSVVASELLNEIRLADQVGRSILKAGLPSPDLGESRLTEEGPDPFEVHGDISLRLGQPVIDEATAKSIAFEPFKGERWTARLKLFGDKLTREVFDLVARAKAAEWSTDRLAREVRQASATTEYHARMIAQTELQRAAHEAADRCWQAFGDLIAGYEYMAAWERTCIECGVDDGKVFRADESRPVLPRHPWCACTYAPVTRTWRELGLPIDEIPMPGRQLAGHRYVRGRVNWRDWFAAQPAVTQRQVLGAKRYDVWAKGGKRKSDLASPRGAVRRRPKRKTFKLTGRKRRSRS